MTHVVIALLFSLSIYWYFSPQYIHGYNDNDPELDHIIQQEYRQLISYGWKDIHEIGYYLQNYRKNRQQSCIVLYDRYHGTILQIPINQWILYRIQEVAANWYSRIYDTVISTTTVLEDAAEGHFQIQHMGDFISNVIWIIYLYAIYVAVRYLYHLRCRNDTRHTHDTISENTWVLVDDGSQSRIISFYELVNTVNHPIEQIRPPRIYEWIYNIVGIHLDENI